MSTIRQHTFETPASVRLVVRTGSGTVRVRADADDGLTHVGIAGHDADQVVVEHRDDAVVVAAPRQRSGFWAGDTGLDVEVVVPPGSRLEVRVGSADVTVDGRVGTSQLRSGSGSVTVATAVGALLVETGSGDVTVQHALEGLRVKSGSGDVRVERCEDSVAVSTGSGDVSVREALGATAVKTGSGALHVVEAHDDVSMSTASGDLVVETLHRGRLTAKGASGDVEVGVAGGVPVWTDVTTLTGHVSSRLEHLGAPAEGQDHVEVRATSVSGSVALHHR